MYPEQGCSGVGTAFPHLILMRKRVLTPFCTRLHYNMVAIS